MASAKTAKKSQPLWASYLRFPLESFGVRYLPGFADPPEGPEGRVISSIAASHRYQTSKRLFAKCFFELFSVRTKLVGIDRSHVAGQCILVRFHRLQNLGRKLPLART